MKEESRKDSGKSTPNKKKARVCSTLTVLLICIAGCIILTWVGEKKIQNLWTELNLYIAICILLVVVFWPFFDLIYQRIFYGRKGKKYTPKIFNLVFRDFMTPWIAFWAFWGIVVGVIQGNRQISEQNEQIKTQKVQFLDQMNMQEKQLRETRFSSGVGLLGSVNESARIGGAYHLYFLANEFKDDYQETVCEILCAHIRTITGNDEYRAKYREKPSN